MILSGQTLEEVTSRASFSAFASVAAIGAADDAMVIIDRNIDVADQEGNIRHFSALVSVLKADFPTWESGDLLEHPTGNVKLRQLFDDDGYIVKIEASPVG